MRELCANCDQAGVISFFVKTQKAVAKPAAVPAPGQVDAILVYVAELVKE